MGTINQLIDASVGHFGEHPALIEPVEGGGMSTLTYRELGERVHGFAGYLQEQQVEKDDRICIWSASCTNWMVAYLGTLLVGAIVVPLDINTKEDFLTRIAQTTEARLLITTRKQFASLKQAALSLVDIDALPQGTLDTSKLAAVAGDDLAELVFTSGTTGQPKGVMLSHQNISSNANAGIKVINIQAGDRALSILPLSHMFEMTVEIALLCCGASIVYARTLVPETLLKLFAAEQVTCMVLVPQALQLFMNGIEREVRRQKKVKQWEMLHSIAARLPFGLRHLLFGSVHKRFGGHFRFFISGGAYLPPQLAQRWEDMGLRVMQGYGATECSPIITVTPYDEHVLDSVGKPLPGVDVCIAGDGEILVHGPNVALGYWKNPEATAAAFEGTQEKSDRACQRDECVSRGYRERALRQSAGQGCHCFWTHEEGSGSGSAQCVVDGRSSAGEGSHPANKPAARVAPAGTRFHYLAGQGFPTHAHAQGEAARGAGGTTGNAAGGIACSTWSQRPSGT